MFARLILIAWGAGAAGYFAGQRSGLAAGLLTGILSAAALFLLAAFVRSRALTPLVEGPGLQSGEEGRLFGPARLKNAQGWAEAWLFLTDRRLVIQPSGGGAALELALADLEEVRPLEGGGWFKGGVLALVSAKQGLVTVRVPDQKRWLAALRRGS